MKEIGSFKADRFMDDYPVFSDNGKRCAVASMVNGKGKLLVSDLDGKPARYDSPTIMIGGRESYQARCRHCHKVPRQDEDQTALL